MRLHLGELFAKLYVYRSLGFYDMEQWSVFNEDVGASCAAEVRVDGFNEEIEVVEAQVIVTYDNPTANMPRVVQTCYIKAEKQSQGDFSIKKAIVNQKDKVDSAIFDWGNKSLRFFTLIARELERGNLPDFDDIEKIAFDEKGMFADKMGDGGSKSPKINSEQLLKAGRGF